jgi:tRNA 2-thiouridine synthesizing protein D
MGKTLTVLVMDPPFESANTTTAFRIIEAALRKGHTVNVFAYEGAANLTMQGQQPHPNPAHGKTVEEEHHPLTRDIVRGLLTLGGGERLQWINCGLCVDERGAGDWIDGPRRGGPGDFWKWVTESDQTLVIPCR